MTATTRNILHVEDETQVRELVQQVLGRAGFKVLSFASLREAKQHLASSNDRIELFICDSSLENLGDGWEWAHGLYIAGKKVILLSHMVEDGGPPCFDKALL